MNTSAKPKKVLLIGGNGYIGSHTALALHEAGYAVGLLDNLSSSTQGYLEKLKSALGSELFIKIGDSRNLDDLVDALNVFKPTAVVHFAGYKSVPLSVQDPLSYYEHNILSLITALRAMKKTETKHIIFSSSAAVYGHPKQLPIPETHTLNPTNPYGHTKAMGEQIISDFITANGGSGIALRYFNPVGADPLGRIGEDSDTSGNVAPIIAKALTDQKPFTLTGDDFNTKDGTGERDFIHVMDLAEAHVKAVEHSLNVGGFKYVNIGTGTPYSVKELIAQFERASNRKAEISVVPRRQGDVDQCWANPNLASETLEWSAKRTLYDMCKDHWNWLIKRQNQ